MRMWSGRAFQVAGPACENARYDCVISARQLTVGMMFVVSALLETVAILTCVS